MFYTVYKITNNINKKIYIGAHRTLDLNDGYMGSGELIIKAIKKYGLDNFTKEYIAIFNNVEEMFKMESLLVGGDFIKRSDTYNLKEGGNGGDTSKFVPYDDPSYKEKIGNARKKFLKENPEIFKELCKNLKIWGNGSFLGKHHTEETKKKIGEKNSKHQEGEKNSQYGTCWIYSLTKKTSIKIKKSELNDYLSKGWIKGRKLKF